MTTFHAHSPLASFDEIKRAVSNAYQDALAFAQRECGRGTFMSRGKTLMAFNSDQIDPIAGEAESWLWDGTKAGLIAAISHAESKGADSLVIQGGINYAANPQDYADGAYDPWVGEWAVTVWSTRAE